MTVFFHLFAPQFYYLGGLTHDVGGSTGDNLDLTAGGEFHAGRAGADGLEKGRIGLLHRLGQHPEVIHIGELAVIGQFLLRSKALIMTSTASANRSRLVSMSTPIPSNSCCW